MATSSRTGCVAEVAVTMTSASLTHSSTLSWTRTVICVDALRSSANLSAPARFRFHRLIWAKIYRINQPFPVAQSISSSLIHYPPARYLLAHSNSFLIFSLSNYIRTNRNDVNYIQPIQKKNLIKITKKKRPFNCNYRFNASWWRCGRKEGGFPHAIY